MRYRVSVPVLVPTSAWVDVVADSPADALDAARSADLGDWVVDLDRIHARPFDLEIDVDNEADVYPIEPAGSRPEDDR